MISENDAKKLYPRHTEVVRRGDRKWTSDRNHDKESKLKSLGATESKAHQKLQSSRYHMNPLSLINAGIAQRERAALPELPDLDELGHGDEYIQVEGRDRVCYRVCDYGHGKSWRRAWVSKGGADR